MAQAWVEGGGSKRATGGCRLRALALGEAKSLVATFKPQEGAPLCALAACLGGFSGLCLYGCSAPLCSHHGQLPSDLGMCQHRDIVHMTESGHRQVCQPGTSLFPAGDFASLHGYDLCLIFKLNGQQEV